MEGPTDRGNRIIGCVIRIAIGTIFAVTGVMAAIPAVLLFGVVWTLFGLFIAVHGVCGLVRELTAGPSEAGEGPPEEDPTGLDLEQKKEGYPMHRRTYRYRPNKLASVISIAMGAIFVVVGVTVAIPATGLFGVVWTLFALLITIANIYGMISRKGYGSIEMEEDGFSGEPSGLDFEQKLIKLQRLYDQRLITRDEYDQKRAEIMAEKW